MKTIELTQGAKAIVCDCHYYLVKDYRWHLTSGGYAGRKIMAILCPCGCKGSRQVNMHRVINDTPEELQTDHINHNRLDNRCVNLRSVTRSENLINRGGYGKSGYKFVHQMKPLADRGLKSWAARHRDSPKDAYTHLGVYETAEEAAKIVEQHLLTGKMPTHVGKKYREKTRAKYEEL